MKGLKPAHELWILLVVAMVIFIGLSFSRDIKIGNYTLSKAYFPESLLANDRSEEEVLPAEEPDSIPEPQEEIVVVEPDTTVHSVLVFGDSMTHHLAMSISKYGTKNNYKVTGVTWESSSIPAWANSNKIEEYFSQTKPDFVIISLGSNEMELRNFERRIPDVEKILKKVGDVPYIWVGPPLWKNDKGVYEMLYKAVSKDKVFRIDTSYYIERGPDHVHPTKRGADVWADTLMRWLKDSPHPILVEKPDSGTTTKGHKFIYLHPED